MGSRVTFRTDGANETLAGLNPHTIPFTRLQFDLDSWPSTTKKQNIAVSVLEFESTQAIPGIFEWLEKLNIARRELRRQRIGIGDLEVGVPAGDTFLDVSRVVRHWIYSDVLEHDHRGTALDNAKEDVVWFGSLKRNVELESV